MLICISAITILVAQSNNLVLNEGFESLNLYDHAGNTFNINGVGVKIPKGKDVFQSPWAIIDTNHIRRAVVSSSYWNFSNNDSTTVSNSYYSNLGEANNGYAFSSLIPFRRVDEDIFETTHLVGRTCQPLIKGNSYQLSFWIKLNEGNTLIDHLDIYFSDEVYLKKGRQKVRFKKKKIIPLSDELPLYQVEKLPSDCKVLIPESTMTDYQLVTCEYIARGGETYIYFGNLDYELPETLVKVIAADTGKKKLQTPFCYYYIDDVVLTSQDESEICVNKKEEVITATELVMDTSLFEVPKVEVKKEIIIGDQYFASGSYELKETNILNLEYILSTIDYEEISVIRITGHTDNVGALEDNQILSLKRAGAIGAIVQKYFPTIHLFGMGETQPKYSNETAEGKLKNRRVVLEIFNKK